MSTPVKIGLPFTPMDILNPFDPSAVDKEYKSGDDMLYGQYLYDNGNDIQAVVVVRRDPISAGTTAACIRLETGYPGARGAEYSSRSKW